MSSVFQVKIWFQNRRMKWRNSKERELLSSGGSRESTLPNKNNPNPDLSDINKSSDIEDGDNQNESAISIGCLSPSRSPESNPPSSPMQDNMDINDSDDEINVSWKTIDEKHLKTKWSQNCVLRWFLYVLQHQITAMGAVTILFIDAISGDT